MSKEPILFLVLGGSALAQGVVQTLRAFGVHISEPEEVAIYSLWTVIIGVLARMCVVPVSQLPPGTLDKMASTQAANVGAKP